MEDLTKEIKSEVAGNKLVLTIDISGKGKVSASGKSMVVASTRGNVAVADTKGLILGLNLYRKVSR